MCPTNEPLLSLDRPSGRAPANTTSWTEIICQAREVTPQHGPRYDTHNWMRCLAWHEHRPFFQRVFAARLKDKSNWNSTMYRAQHHLSARSWPFFRSQVAPVPHVPVGKVIHWLLVPGSSRSQHGVAVEPVVPPTLREQRQPGRRRNPRVFLISGQAKSRPSQPSESSISLELRPHSAGIDLGRSNRPLMDVGEPLLGI